MKKVTIHVVDDDPYWSCYLRDLLEAKFRPPHYLLKVEMAEHGGEALGLVQRSAQYGELPDLILSDTNMPTMDGIAFWQELRSRGLNHIPFVLFFSGLNSRPDLTDEDLLRMGIQNIVAKDDSLEQMVNKIKEVLGLAV